MIAHLVERLEAKVINNKISSTFQNLGRTIQEARLIEENVARVVASILHKQVAHLVAKEQNLGSKPMEWLRSTTHDMLSSTSWSKIVARQTNHLVAKKVK